MMQATDRRLGSEATDWSACLRILGSQQVRTSLVVVAGIFGQSYEDVTH
jgi:hypothetical protein